MRRSRSTLNTPSTMPVRIASPSACRRRSSEVSWSRRRRISSMVAASVPSSAPGARGRGRREVAAADPRRRGGERLDGAGEPPADQEPRERGERGHQQREEQQLAHQPGERGGHGAARQRGLDQRRHLARGGAQGADGDVEPGASSAARSPAGPSPAPRPAAACGGPSASASARSGSRMATGSPTWAAIWRAKAGSSTRAAAAVASGVLASGEAAPSRREPSGQAQDRRALAAAQHRLPGDRRAAGGDEPSPARRWRRRRARWCAGSGRGRRRGRRRPPFHQPLDRGALGQQMGRGPHVARRAPDRLLGRRPREVDPRDPLLVREPLDQPQSPRPPRRSPPAGRGRR